MENTAFIITLTNQEWDETLGGWRCSAIRIPGAKIESIYADRRRIDPALYEVLINHQMIRWSQTEKPEKVAVSIILTKELSTYELTGKWKKLAIILPILAMLLSTMVTASVTLYISKHPKPNVNQSQASTVTHPKIPPHESISCDITNPLSTDDIRWDKTELKIEGSAVNIAAVWILVKSLDENNRVCSTPIKSKVNNKLWEATIKLIPSITSTERRYSVSIFPDSIDNNNYFNKILSKKSENQELFDLPSGEPNDSCHSIIIKRINR